MQNATPRGGTPVLRQEDYETIVIEREGNIAVLTMNRPDVLNAVNDTMHAELSTIFHDAQRDRDLNVLVLTGAGRGFSAGGDFSPDRTMQANSGRTLFQQSRHIIDLE